jgi:hypothetical protein
VLSNGGLSLIEEALKLGPVLPLILFVFEVFN